MQGKTVIELPELSKISTKSEDKIKEFITMGTDSWTPKYSNQPVTVVRRSIMFATTNKRRYLTDVTGNRRWLPLTCCAEGGMIDRDTLIRERDQYWAEALTLFKETGIQWREAEALAKPYIDAATVINPWHNLVARYLADGRTATDGVSIYLEALGGDRRSFDDRTQRKIARCLTMLGWDSPNADDNWVMSDLD